MSSGTAALHLGTGHDLLRWRQMAGVRIVPLGEKTPALIAGALVTVSLSGTASLEAGLMGKKAVIFADIFISRLSLVSRLHHPSELTAVLEQDGEIDNAADLEIVDWLLRNAIHGSILEPVTYPSALEPENVEKVADGIAKRLRCVVPVLLSRSQ